MVNPLWRNVFPAALATAVAVGGCGGKVVIDGEGSGLPTEDAGQVDSGSDAGVDSGTDGGVDAGSDADSGVPDNLLTRRIFTQDLVGEVMGYDGDCPYLSYPDVPVSDELCLSAHILNKRGAYIGHPDGTFHSDDYMIRASVWKEVAIAIGLARYDASCLEGVQDVSEQDWFYKNGGAVCDKGLPFAKNGEARLEDAMTLDEWDEFKAALNGDLDKLTTRARLAELVAVEYLGNSSFYDTDQCVSGFPDVVNGTLDCQTTAAAFNAGLIAGYPNGLFMPDNTVNYAEFSKISVIASQLEPVNPPDGCSGNDPDSWFVHYMDALCPYGSASWYAGDPAVNSVVYRTTWDIKMSE